jgi:hypothetical protein
MRIPWKQQVTRPIAKIGIQNDDPTDYFGDNPERAKYVSMLRLFHIPSLGERLLFLEKFYEVERVVTDLETGDITILIKNLGSVPL